MTKRKLIPGFMAVILVLSLIYSPAALAGTFRDVPADHWAYEDIDFMSDYSVINGFKGGYFKPGLGISRKDAAVMMVRALGLTTSGSQPVSLKDMKSYSPGYREVSFAMSRGWFTASNGYFRPDAKLTRNEMAKALAVAFDYEGKGTSSFKDVSKSNPYYKYIDAILYRKVTTGFSDGTFRPLADITRAQFTAFLSRVFQHPLQYTVKAGGKQIASVSSVEEAIGIAGRYQGSTVHPVSNRFHRYSTAIGSANKTGIDSGVLIYNGVGEKESFTPDFFQPYLSYKTANGSTQPMFDTFIVLGLRYAGGTFAESPDNKANYKEWQTQIDRTFKADGALKSLNDAAKKQSRTADVYLSIPYPKRGEAFITLDGRKVANTYDSRYAITQWYIKAVTNRMAASGFSNLNFKGFYWTNETVIAPEDEKLVTNIAKQIHAGGKFFIYAPHALSTNFSKWQSYGFDASFLQPNSFRTAIADKEARLHRSFVNAQIYGSGITMEIDSYSPHQAQAGVEAFDLYIEFAERYGLDEGSMIMYQATDMVNRMGTYNDPIYKRWYEQLTGTFFSDAR